MENFYNLDGIVTNLKKELDTCEAFLEKWKSVTFPTKKDGTPFANLQKNIVGARVFTPAYMMFGENQIEITTWTKLSGYQNDTVNAYCLVEDLKDECKKAKTQNYQPKQSYLRQVYTYDIEDIKEAIEKRINSLEARKNSLINQIENAERIYREFECAYKKAVSDLADKCAEINDPTYNNSKNSLYYAVLGTVQKSY